MNYKIVADSSSNVYAMDAGNYEFVSLKIRCGDMEYIDEPGLDTMKMMDEFDASKEASQTSCPNVYEWSKAFEGADGVFAVTITSNLSGSCSAALQAKELCLENTPDQKICVIDSLSTGPEMHLIIDKLQELIAEKLSFEEIETKIRAYCEKTHLLFCLKSLANLARNGRVSPAVAKIAGLLGIRVVGKASDVGTLQQLHKCQGERRALEKIFEEMLSHKFSGGRVIISHCFNLDAANALAKLIRDKFAQCEVLIENCGGLCTYYAERGGLIIGFEG